MNLAPVRTEVVVVGGGPAGRAIADHCARHGLDTVLVATRPDARWVATYGLWAEQTAALPTGAAWVAATAIRGAGRPLAGRYVTLDNRAVLAAYARGPVRTVAGRVVGAEYGRAGAIVLLGSGRVVHARLVVDATGARRVLCGGPPGGTRAEQTAYGLVLPGEAARPLVPPGEAVLMRWDRRRPGWPTFLYAVPLPGGRVLLEETSLVRRPGLAVAELRRRLTRRLRRAGVPVEAAQGTERVRFAMDLPRVAPAGGAVPFGVAAGMMHPATGYSVGETLAAAPGLAAAIAEALPRGPEAARRAARDQLWPARARAVRRLRAWGGRTLLALPPAQVPAFFDAFFAVPGDLQHAYLCGRDDLAGTAAAMLATAGRLPRPLRARMVLAGLGNCR